MRKLWCGLALSLLWGSSVAAQTTTSPTPGSAGSGLQVPVDLDLPLQKPHFLPAIPQPPLPPQPRTPGLNLPPSPGPTSTPTSTPPTPDDPTDAPPPIIYGEEIGAETDTIVYVIDQSGSMGWDVQSYLTMDGQRATGPRMDRAKLELSRSIMGLAPNFRFDIVSYDCATRLWASGLREANDANKSSALAWVARLTPIGATGTGPAVSLGLSVDRTNLSVVLLTDGAPNCGVPESQGAFESPEITASHRRMISGANGQGAKISVFGIAASGTYREFCQNVAADSGGAYFDVP